MPPETITRQEFEYANSHIDNVDASLTGFLNFTGTGDSLRASHWVGVNCSVDGEHVLCVLPKYAQFDPAGIFLDGLPHLDYREEYHPKKLFKVDVSSGKRVTMPEKLRSTWSLFLIIVFVEELKKLLDRRPKRDYRWQVHNQVGVVRGRIRMQDHIRLNLARGLPHRICTESLEFDHQNPLNQILKAACIHAQQGWAHLRGEAKGNPKTGVDDVGKSIDAVASKLSACLDLLSHVERPLSVTPTLIAQARRGLKGHYAPYRPVLDWAVSILRNEYCRMKVEEGTSYKTVPFALNMNALFELHVRTTILKQDGCTRCDSMDHKQAVFFKPVGGMREVNDTYGPWSGREPDLIVEKDGTRILVECKYQRFQDKRGDESDWMEKFIADEKDRDGDAAWKVDPHFEVPRHGFFQTLAYMQLFNCNAGLIVYPTTASAGEEHGDPLVGLSGADPNSRKPFGYVPIGPDENQKTKACNAALVYAIGEIIRIRPEWDPLDLAGI